MWNSIAGMLGGSGAADSEALESQDAESQGGNDAKVDIQSIRQRRLARLGGTTASSNSKSNREPSAPIATASSPAVPAETSEQGEGLRPELQERFERQQTLKIEPKAYSKPSPSSKQERKSKPDPALSPRRSRLDTSTKCISYVLRVKVNTSGSAASHDTLSYLPSLASQWNADSSRGKPLTMEFTDIQEIIQARLELNGQPPLGWLLGSLERADIELRKDELHDDSIKSVLNKIDSVLCNWLMTILQVDNMFPPARGHNNGVAEMAARILGTLGSENDRSAALLAVGKMCSVGLSKIESGSIDSDVEEFTILREILCEIILGNTSPLRPSKKRKRESSESTYSGAQNPLAQMMRSFGAANNPIGTMLSQLSTGNVGATGNAPAFSSSNDVVVRMISSGPFLSVQRAILDVCQNRGALEHVLLKCKLWSNENHHGINTGALLEHRTVLGTLLCFGCTGHPDIPDSLFDRPSKSNMQGSQQNIGIGAGVTNNGAGSDADDIYGDGPSPAQEQNALNQPQQQPPLTAQERALLTNRQQMYAMGISGPPRGHVPTPADHPLTNVQARNFLFSQPGLMIGANEIALAVRDFPRPFFTTMPELEAAERRIYGATLAVWDSTAKLITSILKRKTLRKHMVRWLACAVALQRGREKSHRSIFRESSDSFSLSLFATNLRLFQPLLSLDPSSGEWTSLDKIRSDFFHHPSVAESALQGVSDVFPSNSVLMPRIYQGGDFSSLDSSCVPSETDISDATAGACKSFPTQCFFLTSMSMHLSLMQVIRQSEAFNSRLIGPMMHHHGRESPIVRSCMSVHLVRQIEASNPDLLTRTVRFCSFQACWLLKRIGIRTSTMEASSSTVSWRPQAVMPSVLTRIPLFLLEDLATLLSFLGRGCGKSPHFANALANGAVIPNFVHLCKPIIRVLTAFLAGGNTYITNPGVRTAIGNVFFVCFFDQNLLHQDDGERPPTQIMSRNPSHKPVLPVSLLNDPEMVSVLLPALLEVYGDAEHTGFYEAPIHRKRLTIVIRFLLAQQQHRDALLSRSKIGDAQVVPEGSNAGGNARAFSFISSANGLMNQANSSITDGMSKLQAIKSHQDAKRNVMVWQSRTAEERKEQESEFEDNEKACNMHMKTAMQSLELFASITEHVRKPFMSSVLLGRVAVTLMNLLNKMVESQGNLKVENPEKYHFYPKRLLRLVILATLNMFDDGGKSGNSSGSKVAGEDSKRFVAAVADFFTGSFDVATFDKALGIMKKHKILWPGDRRGKGKEEWARLGVCVREEVQLQVADEEMLGEVPEEFECPLLCTLMTDPVKLPDGTIVDRDSIMQQLLNTGKNPYTNLPMSVDDLVPVPELRAQIEDWIKKQRAGKTH